MVFRKGPHLRLEIVSELEGRQGRQLVGMTLVVHHPKTRIAILFAMTYQSSILFCHV